MTARKNRVELGLGLLGSTKIHEVKVSDIDEQQRAFKGQVLVVWAREDRPMPPEHAWRLAEHFEHAELVRVDDARTLIPHRPARGARGTPREVPGTVRAVSGRPSSLRTTGRNLPALQGRGCRLAPTARRQWREPARTWTRRQERRRCQASLLPNRPGPRMPAPARTRAAPAATARTVFQSCHGAE